MPEFETHLESDNPAVGRLASSAADDVPGALTGAYPYIRDELVIDETVQAFCSPDMGSGPVFLVGRVVRHAQTLRIARPVVIVADVYDGTGGGIDASGVSGAGGASGADGQGPGAGGNPGGAGGSGGPGGTVTVYCRRSINAQISVRGGPGGPAGNGGNGAGGTADSEIAGYTEVVDSTPDDLSDFATHEVYHPPVPIPGIPGGKGGWGGAGGSGGPGGTIAFTSIADDTAPVLDAAGGAGQPGGYGGTGGMFAPAEEDGTGTAPQGAEGSWGANGVVTQSIVSEEDFAAGLRPLLGAHADDWAQFRAGNGEYLYHRHNDDIPDRADCSERAAAEFQRALELQPMNPKALALQRQLESGVNALGLDPDLDVLPSFTDYISAYTGFGGLALNFLTSGTQDIVNALTLAHLATFAELMRMQTASAKDAAVDQRGIARTEEQLATDEIDHAQRRLDQASADITAEMERMEQAALESDGIFGTVAQVAVAVVGVIAAVPTAGASLVALVPAVVSLADIALDEGPDIVKAVMQGSEADVENIKKAYKKIGKKETDAVAQGAKSIMNFVSVIEKLTASKTTDNARYVDLVRRGTELTHELLLARRRAGLAGQRVAALENQIARADVIIERAAALRDDLTADAGTLRAAGGLSVATAQAAATTLLGLAFRAQRAVEIYTLKDEGAHLDLATGMLDPDFVRRYQEARHTEADLVAALKASWSGLMQPIAIQGDYTSYFDTPPDHDQLRLTFEADSLEVESLRATNRLAFRVDVGDIPDGRYDAKVVGVRIALVGATHPNGEVSCQLRHGAQYAQRRPDGSVHVQLLAPRTSTRKAMLTTLPPDPGFTPDPPLTAPTTLRFWGRGLAGDWELSIPDDQLPGLDLSGVTAVQVWLGYRFVG
jgi:hypothetical protein